MPLKKSGYTISNDAIEYIKKYKEKNKCSSQSKALEKIIEDHKHFESETRGKEIEYLAERLSKNVLNNLKGMKLGVDNADRNTQILIEMINGRYIKDRVGEIVTTTGVSSRFARKSEALEIAEAEVKKRIHRAKVMKSYRK
ncbi:hypothetical protein [Clostridium baratii]|uniref:hypothetical protein n=1 Tax=Clostridium baratii TaxID=1561 RepID=UPI0030D384F0